MYRWWRLPCTHWNLKTPKSAKFVCVAQELLFRGCYRPFFYHRGRNFWGWHDNWWGQPEKRTANLQVRRKKRVPVHFHGHDFRNSAETRLCNPHRAGDFGSQFFCRAQNRWFTCTSVRSQEAIALSNTPWRNKSRGVSFLTLKTKNVEKYQFWRLSVF